MKRLILVWLLLLSVVTSHAQFYSISRINNDKNILSDWQMTYVVTDNGVYNGYNQGIFEHKGPSVQTLVNKGVYNAYDGHTDKFMGPGGKPGAQEIAGSVRPYFFNLQLLNGADQTIAITNTDGANVRNIATFSNGITTTIRSNTASGAIRFEHGSTYIGSNTDAQHVNGYVSKIGTSAITFPVGSGTDSRPLTMSEPPTVTDQYSVAWIAGDPTSTADPSGTPALHPIASFDGASLSAVSPVGQWDWIVVSGTGVGLTITASIPDMTAFGPATSLRLVGWNGNQWVNLSTGAKPFLNGTSYASANTENSELVGAMVAGISAIGIGMLPTTVSLAGNVFDDGNGLTDNLINQTGAGPNPLNGTDIDPLRSGSQPLYVSLVSSASGIVGTVPVTTTGSYSFSSVSAGTYSVVLHTNPAGSPTASLPTSWTNTGESLGTGASSDGTVDGILAGLVVNTASVSGANFGIDRLPEGASVTLASQTNPGGTNRASVPVTAFTGTDLEDGTYTSNLAGRAVSLRPATGGTLYYQGNPVTAPLTIPIFDPTQVSLDPTSTQATSVTFEYRVRDNANVFSNPGLTPALISFPFTPSQSLTLSGHVYNDGNGLTDNLVNGAPVNGSDIDAAATGAQALYATLVKSATALNTVVVTSTGTYSFTNVVPGTYSVVLSTSAVGSLTASLPTGWVNTGEHVGASMGSDGTANGILSDINVERASVDEVNFGIDQKPKGAIVILPYQPNPEGARRASVYASAFTGSDLEDGEYINNLRSRSVSLSPATGGTLYYQNSPVSAQQDIASFDPAQVTLDPAASGATFASFTYSVNDNAGVASDAKTIVSPFYKDENKDDNQNEQKEVELPDDVFPTGSGGGLGLPGLPGLPPLIGLWLPSWPSGAGSVKVGDKTYTEENFPEEGITLETDEKGNLKDDVTVEPRSIGIPIVIPFIGIGAGGTSVTPVTSVTIITTPFGPLSGRVFNDGNGLTDNTVNGTPVNGSDIDAAASGVQALYATLVRNATAQITVAVTSTGTYSFDHVAPGTYSVVMSTNPQGSLTASLPAGWVATGEHVGTGTGNDGTADGILSGITVGTTSVEEASFGIERKPQGANMIMAFQANPERENQAPVYTSAFTGSDPEDGTYTNNLRGRSVSLSPATGGTLYYQGNPISQQQTIPLFDPAQVMLDPTASGSTFVSFTYSVNDNAGVASDAKVIVAPFYKDENKDDDQNGSKEIELAEDIFSTGSGSGLGLGFPGFPSLLGIRLPSFPSGAGSVKVGDKVYTEDDFPEEGVMLETDEEGNLIDDVTVEPRDNTKPVVIVFVGVGLTGTVVTPVNSLTINPPLPDLVPIIYASPTAVYGTSSVSVVVDVIELTSTPTSGLVRLILTKDTSLQLSFDGSLTNLGGKSVKNQVWSLDNTNDSYYVLSTNEPIKPDQPLSVGLSGVLRPGATTGKLTVSVTVGGGSGGEINLMNNVDADKIEYFRR